MKALRLEDIRPCFEGAVPATIVTCSNDGTVNITPLSHVYYIDSRHVAVSAQFFNKTRHNLQENPYATVMVMDPLDLTQYTLEAEYLFTESAGRTFERMKQKLDNIAAITGMESVFKLRGADVYRVTSCTLLQGDTTAATAPRLPRLEQVAEILAVINQCHDMEEMFDRTLEALDNQLGYRHSIIFLRDHDAARLYTVASRGYSLSGAGAEVDVGEGIVGTVAANGQAMRLTNMARDLIMSRAIQKSIDESRGELYSELDIPLPGLENALSLMAVPLLVKGQCLGALYIESDQIMAYYDEDLDAASSVAQNLAMALAFYQLQQQTESHVVSAESALSAATPEPVLVRYYEADHSIFLGSDYLIKGVAGSILWKLLCQWQQRGQSEFTNRELRRAPDICLPEIGDNLEARLILLRKRLHDRRGPIHIEKRGRGRFALVVDMPLELRHIAAQ